MMRFMDSEEADDPVLSLVNLIDLFLVVIGILLIIIVRNPLNPFTSNNVTVIENPGTAEQRITIKEGQELRKYEASKEMGEGEGVKAGITYKLADGRLIYVPETAEGGAASK